MIRSLKLKNFKRHAAAEFNFAGGLNVVRGPNGSGKSTIQKAILYALAGAGAAGAKEHLKRWGSGKEQMQVTLTLDLPGYGTCTVLRSISAAKVTDADGKLLASGHSPVTAFIEDVLGVDNKTFRMLAHSPQGETAGLLALGATALQRRVEEIAKVDIIDQVVSLVTQDVTHLEGEVAGLGEIPDVTALEEQWRDAELRSQSLEEEVRQLTSRLGLAQGARNEVLDKYHRAQAAEQERAALQSQVQSASEQTAFVEERAKALAMKLGQFAPDLDKLVTEAEEAQQAWCGWVTHVRDLKTRRDTLEPMLKKQRVALQQVERDLEDSDQAEAQCAEVEARWRVAQDEATPAAVEEARLTRQLQDARKMLTESKCHACGREFEPGCEEHAKARVAELEPLVQAATQKTGTLQTRADNLRDELSALKLRVRPDVRIYHGRLLAEIADLEQQLSGLQEVEVPSCPQPLPLPEALSTVTAYCDSWKTRLEELKSLMAQRQTTQAQLNADREALAKLKLTQAAAQQRLDEAATRSIGMESSADLGARWQELNGEVERLQAEASQVSQALSQARFQLEALSRQLEEIAQRAQRRREIEAEVSLIKQLQSFLRTNRSRLADEMWQGLVSYASDLITTVTDGRLSGLRRDDNGGFFVTETVEGEVNQDTPIAELSGAQRAIVGVSLRLSLSATFYGTSGTLLLDEISSDMDDANAAATAGMLMSLPNQVLLVTHRHHGDAAQGSQTLELAA